MERPRQAGGEGGAYTGGKVTMHKDACRHSVKAKHEHGRHSAQDVHVHTPRQAAQSKKPQTRCHEHIARNTHVQI